MKIPKDLGAKIGSEAQAIWERVAEEAKAQIKNTETNLIVQKAMLVLAEGKIEFEKANMKSKS